MKTGIELIAQERKEQFEKHGHTIEGDFKNNSTGELLKAVNAIIDHDHNKFPSRWDKKMSKHIHDKKLKERLSIAGAFIAAEIDRLQHKS
jgi:hypothetical protein